MQQPKNELYHDFTPIWHLPSPLKTFTGRTLQLGRLTEAFQKKQQHMVISHPKKITGTGGIGKTQLAIQFAHNMIRCGRYRNVIWLNADTSSFDQLRSEFTQLANALDVSTNQADVSQMVKMVYQRLSELGDTLVILDNATSFETVQAYLPPEHSPMSVLVTTRDNTHWQQLFEQLPLDIFDLHEAVEFLKKALPNHLFDEHNANRLAEALGRFPLGLAQAAGYIITHNIAIETYLNLYNQRKNQQPLLDKKPLLDDPHQETIWLTVNLCMEQIHSSFAKQLMSVSAMLAAEAPIDLDLLSLWSTGQNSVCDAVQQLQNYSLLEETTLTGHVRIHQLVQDILLLIEKNKQSLPEQQLTVAKNLNTFYYQDANEKVTYYRHNHLLPHTQKLLKTLANTEHQNDPIVVRLESNSGNTFEATGDYASQRKAYLHAIELVKAQPNSEQKSLELAMLYNALSNALGNTGEVDSKIYYLQESIRLIKSVTGERLTLEILTPMSNLANAFGDQGKYQQKIELLEEITPLMETHQPGHVNCAIAWDNLANAYFQIKDYRKAEPLYKRSVDFFKEKYGDDNPEYAARLSNLGMLYSYMNQARTSIQMLQKSLKILADHYGENHIKSARTLNALAYAYGEVGQPQKQVELLAHALTVKKQFFGEQHPETAKAKSNLADGYKFTQNYPAAIKLYQQSLPVLTQYYGLDHQATETTAANYITVLILMRQHEAAENFCLNRIQANEQVNGKNPFSIVSTLKSLALIYASQKDFKRVIPTLERALNIHIKHLGHNDPRTASAKVDLVMNLISSIQIEQFGRALQLAREAHQVLYEERDNPRYISAFEMCQQALPLLENPIPITQTMRSEMIASYKPVTLPGKFDTTDIDKLKTLRKINDLDTIYAFAETCIAHHNTQLALTVCTELQRNGQMSLKICELVVECSLPLGYLNSCAQHIKAAFEFGGSDKIMQQMDELDKLQKAEPIQREEKQRYLSKLKNGTATAKDIIHLAIRCVRLGEFDEAITYLDTPLIHNADSKTKAAALFQRAKCAFYTAKFDLAIEAIENSLTLNPNEKRAVTLSQTIAQGAACFRPLVEILQHIAWKEIPECEGVGARFRFIN